MAKTKKQTPAEPQEGYITKPKRRREPALLSETLEDLKDKLPALKSAAELAPPEREVIEPEPNVARQEMPTFADRITANRSSMLPVPQGFHNVASYPQAGIRVNKSSDRRIAAVQFSEDRLPTRQEKDILEALGQPEEQKFTYKPATRQWQREASDAYGVNIIDATRIASDLAREREGRER